MNAMFAKGSARFLLPAAAIAGALAAGSWVVPSLAFAAGLALLILLFFLWFFRDPERTIGPHVVSPADGRVLAVEAVGNESRLSIFMTPTSVHVNRAPVAGRIEALEYRRGAHRPAFRKESALNERLDVDLVSGTQRVRVRLIAGTMARRIHPYVTAGAEVKKGDRIGLIAFGSRCELLLPSTRYRLTVGPGDWVKAGESPVAQEVR